LEWAMLPLFRYDRRPMKVLHGQLAIDPQFFADVISLGFRGENDEDPDQPDDEHRVRAKIAYALLVGWHVVPGTSADGPIDATQLNEWVDTARRLLATSGWEKIGDQRIGHVLKYAQRDADGSWPPLAVRALVDRIGSDDIETGFIIEEHNSRGVWTKSPAEGGSQERALAERFRRLGAPLANGWPRSAAMLGRLADSYEADARREDERMELRENLD
jgi:hypothetical protein